VHDPEETDVPHALQDHQQHVDFRGQRQRGPPHDREEVEREFVPEKVGKQVFLELVLDGGEVVLRDEDRLAALDLLEDVLLVLDAIPLAGLLPLDDNGLADQLVARETLLAGDHLVAVAGVDVPEVGQTARDVDGREVALSERLQLQVAVVVEFYAVQDVVVVVGIRDRLLRLEGQL
jgi:hypothetical protein